MEYQNRNSQMVNSKPLTVIEKVEMKGQNFAYEIRLTFYARGDKHKFRIDNQSKASGKYIRQVFQEFLPGKII